MANSPNSPPPTLDICEKMCYNERASKPHSKLCGYGKAEERLKELTSLTLPPS